jgi:hypothetical protein
LPRPRSIFSSASISERLIRNVVAHERLECHPLPAGAAALIQIPAETGQARAVKVEVAADNVVIEALHVDLLDQTRRGAEREVLLDAAVLDRWQPFATDHGEARPTVLGGALDPTAEDSIAILHVAALAVELQLVYAGKRRTRIKRPVLAVDRRDDRAVEVDLALCGFRSGGFRGARSGHRDRSVSYSSCD